MESVQGTKDDTKMYSRVAPFVCRYIIAADESLTLFRFYVLTTQQVGLLLVNSVMILNRQRFLAKHGLDDLTNVGGASSNPLQGQLVGLLHAVQYLKLPVIICNILTIAFEIFFGG